MEDGKMNKYNCTFYDNAGNFEYVIYANSVEQALIQIREIENSSIGKKNHITFVAFRDV